MTPATEKWSDLLTRVGSGVTMVLLGLWGVWAGGDVFHVMVAIICGLMVWELVLMLRPDTRGIAIQLGALAGFAVLAAIYLPPGLAMPILLAPAMVGFGQLKENRTIFMVFTVLVLLAGYGMMNARDGMGFVWMLWLVVVVVATDVLGYFAGRIIGGPKFWPSVSPKKTWAGTGFGWAGAALVGFGFMLYTGAGIGLIGISIAVSMASQMGDIAESAIKRKMGVKDSSNLIPGHGGLLDRFDGMLGASLLLLLIGRYINTAPVAG